MHRSKFPPGFLGVRKDLKPRKSLGKFLGEKRRSRNIKQETLAAAIGIARPSLSAIESDKAWPRPDTFEGLARELDLAWKEIFAVDPDFRRGSSSDEDPRADQRLDLVRRLRKGRQQRKLTLADVAKQCGLSAAQLSRIERGEASRSSAFEDHPDHANLSAEFRRIRFRDALLEELSSLGS